MDVIEAAFRSEIDHVFRRFGRKLRYAHYCPRLDPRGVLYLARIVQVQDNVVVGQQLRGAFGDHHQPPGGCERCKILDVVVHFAADDVLLPLFHEELGPAIVDDLTFAQGCIKAVPEFQRQRAFRFSRPIPDRHRGVHGLGVRGEPAHGVLRNVERRGLFFDADMSVALIHVTECDAFVIGSDDEIQLFPPALGLQGDCALVVAVPYDGSLSVDRPPCRVDASGLHRLDRLYIIVITAYAQFRRQYHLFLPGGDRIRDFSGAGIECHVEFQFSVGGNDRHVLRRCGDCAQNQCDCCEKQTL